MKSRSRKLPAVPPLDLVPELRASVLLRLAEDLGPSLDVLDAAVRVVRLERAVVAQMVKPGGPTPAEASLSPRETSVRASRLRAITNERETAILRSRQPAQHRQVAEYVKGDPVASANIFKMRQDQSHKVE